MSINLPLTREAVALKDEELIVSKTNPKGRITRINQTFLDISGFATPRQLPQAKVGAGGTAPGNSRSIAPRSVAA